MYWAWDRWKWKCRLAGALGLDHLACSFLEALASASGVDQPSDEGTISEAKQLLALQTLVFIASRDDAGFLGSAWMTILRTFSKLDLLRVSGSLNLCC